MLITGAIWAKASWGKWWVWDEPTLVSFLIVFLLYVTYYPLRYSIEERDRQARYASVFAIFAGAFVPLNFIAVRLAQTLVHPRVFATADGGLPPKMWITFLVCLAGMALLWQTLVSFELAAKSTRARLGRLRRALDGEETGAGGLADRAAAAGGVVILIAAPLPLDEAGKYVAGAYVVFVALLLIYVAIMATRLARIDREIADLAELAERRSQDHDSERERVPVADLLALGISHKTSPLELRERLALTEGRAVGVLRELLERDEVLEAAAISTCNRTELYLFVSDPVGAESARSACSRARPTPHRPSWSATSTRCAGPRPAATCSRSPPGSTR